MLNEKLKQKERNEEEKKVQTIYQMLFGGIFYWDRGTFLISINIIHTHELFSRTLSIRDA